MQKTAGIARYFEVFCIKNHSKRVAQWKLKSLKLLVRGIMNKPKKPGIDEEEAAIFREAMRILMRNNLHFQSKSNTSKQDDEPETIGFEFSDFDRMAPVKSEDYLEFARSGVQDKTLRKMQRGQYPPEATLDLHRKTIEEARELLGAFLLQCQKRGLRHVLIIHGKGRDSHAPILKNKLNNWLRQTEQILAFCTAMPKNGGSGALYVLLRRER